MGVYFPALATALISLNASFLAVGVHFSDVPFSKIYTISTSSTSTSQYSHDTSAKSISKMWYLSMMENMYHESMRRNTITHHDFMILVNNTMSAVQEIHQGADINLKQWLVEQAIWPTLCASIILFFRASC